MDCQCIRKKGKTRGKTEGTDGLIPSKFSFLPAHTVCNQQHGSPSLIAGTLPHYDPPPFYRMPESLSLLFPWNQGVYFCWISHKGKCSGMTAGHGDGDSVPSEHGLPPRRPHPRYESLVHVCVSAS